ncbi:MAG: hypothetical protein HYZ58_03100 [Acidobacteria bacterium]|nr:hypothetical protein [Acidobacteriota bacterium]MBI3262121.1 hypothetical protein [Acidobacteriota bacterium]
MSPTSRDLFKIAHACARKVDLPRKLRSYPSFSEIEEQCETEYEDLLAVLHEDEIFEPVDIDRQQQIVDQITEALPAARRELIEELVDNHARHVWLQQEAAYHLGLAVGLRISRDGADSALRNREQGEQDEDEGNGDGGPDDEGQIH